MGGFVRVLVGIIMGGILSVLIHMKISGVEEYERVFFLIGLIFGLFGGIGVAINEYKEAKEERKKLIKKLKKKRHIL